MTLGEATKKQFEGIILSDAASESNFIRSNGKFVAVSRYENLSSKSDADDVIKGKRCVHSSDAHQKLLCRFPGTAEAAV